MRAIILLACAAGLAGLVAAPALAATRNAGAGCDLRGLERTDRRVACPAQRVVLPPAQPQVLGGLVSDLAQHLLSTLASVADAGAALALRITSTLLDATTDSGLGSTWFSPAYWRVASVSTLLTLPFLFAAGIHALVRSDPGLVARAAFGYLPLAFLGVAIAAPLTTLVLTATDEMCGVVATAAGHGDTSFLARAAADITAPSALGNSTFVAFFVGVITVAAALALWVELLIRNAAVDVIVLMLPLFFAAMVWPARRVWAIRAVETLIALILSKFAIVAVLTLGGAALSQAVSQPTALLAGATLMLLAVTSPWALLRLLPLHEVAAAAAGGLSRGPVAVVTAAGGHALGALPSPFSAAETATGDEHGLGVQDDAQTALQRATRAIGPDQRRSGGGPTSAGDPRDVDLGDETAGGGGVRGAGLDRAPDSPRATAPAVPLADLLNGTVADDRPPINEAFSGTPWKGWVLGDGGDEQMQAPRLAGGEGAPAGRGDPPPAALGPGDPDPVTDAGPADGGRDARGPSPAIDPPPSADSSPAVDPPPVDDSPPLPPPASREGDGDGDGDGDGEGS